MPEAYATAPLRAFERGETVFEPGEHRLPEPLIDRRLARPAGRRLRRAVQYDSPPSSTPGSGLVVDRSIGGTWRPDSFSPSIPAWTARVSIRGSDGSMT